MQKEVRLMEKKFLSLPKHLPQSSFVDFIIKSFPDWKELNSIYIEGSAYEIIKDFKCCELKQIKLGLWEVLWLERNGNRHYFSNKSYGRSVYISS